MGQNMTSLLAKTTAFLIRTLNYLFFLNFEINLFLPRSTYLSNWQSWMIFFLLWKILVWMRTVIIIITQRKNGGGYQKFNVHYLGDFYLVFLYLLFEAEASEEPFPLHCQPFKILQKCFVFCSVRKLVGDIEFWLWFLCPHTRPSNGYLIFSSCILFRANQTNNF